MIKAPSLLALILMTAACGASPLLHHANAQETPRTNTRNTIDCTLELVQAKLCVKIEFVSTPNSSDEAQFTLKFWSPNNTVNGPYTEPAATPFVQLWMPDMGHGSSAVTLTQREAGVYEVTRAFFIMPGAWEIRVQLRDGNQVLEQVAYSLDIE